METPKHKPHVNIGTIKSIKYDTKTLANALRQIEKLEAEKDELLEALGKVKDYLGSDVRSEIESIIQKHK